MGVPVPVWDRLSAPVSILTPPRIASGRIRLHPLMSDTGRSHSEDFVHENPTPVRERYRALGGEVVLALVQEKSGRTRTSAKQLFRSGRVSLDGKVLTKATEVLSPGAVVTVHSGAKPKDFAHPLLEKIWEDEDLLLVYKKAGIPTVNTSHKDRTQTAIWVLSQALKEQNGPGAMLFMLNRLDKNSEGFVLFAKNIPAKEAMVKQWGNLLKEQLFVLCLEGEMPAKEGVLSHETKGKDGKVTKTVSANYRVLKTGPKGGMAIVELSVRGSRLYNLRTLIKENDLAIFGDVRSRSVFTTKEKIGLVQTKVAFVHPLTHEFLSFERKFPAHFFELLKSDNGPAQSITLEKRVLPGATETRENRPGFPAEKGRPYRNRK